MVRSRSSFENLDAAIASAKSLRPPKKQAEPPPAYGGAPLVSFAGDALSSEAPTPASHPPLPRPSPSTRLESSALDEPATAADSAKKTPKLPDLTGIVSLVLRCERIIEWIVEATGATDVFLADAAGLPLAGALADAEARLAAAGVTAAAITQLATAIPGNTSALFELHLGEGPFFQLIGLEAGPGRYLVGLSRVAPLTPRQAHAVRLACQLALGEARPGA